VAIAPLGYRDETPGLDTIALGFDGSDESLAALRWAEGLVHATDSATLRLIGVYDFVTPTTVAAAESMPVPGLHEVLRRRLSETVSSARAAVSATHRVESNVVDGTAPRALARESEHADLLIVGSRGSGPVLALLAGSVSTALVGMAACPVVVVPREWGS
jgi:nucleotide-binding universal stress UspA family protein